MDNIFSNNPTWTIGIIFGLFGIIAAYRLHMYRDEQNRFKQASQKLTATFNNELADIYPVGRWPENIDVYLRSKFPVLQAAVEEFARHLNKRDSAAFRKAWVSYYSSNCDERCQCYHHYMPFSGSSIENGKETTYDNTKTYKVKFRDNVDNLLRYTKKT